MKAKHSNPALAGGGLKELLVKELKADPAYREEYLKGLLQEKDLPLLAKSLGYVVEALGGVGKLAHETGLNRQNLYKVLSGQARPDFSTLVKVINFAGFDLSLEKKAPSRKHRKTFAVV
jgi:probable addiction module antidote protein